jgi:DNA-binding transcriptional MerR regulator
MAKQLDLFAQINEEIEKQTKEVMVEVPSTKRYYSITEVANMFSVNASLLRFWEKEFPKQFNLRKNGKGDRLFTTDDIKIVSTIYYLTKERKFTLQGTREFLLKDKFASQSESSIINELKTVQAFLETLKNSL